MAIATTHACADGIPDSERQALLDLYNDTNGPQWTVHDGWGGPPGTECSWSNVSCTTTAPIHVIRLDLFNNNLAGGLPALTALSNLRSLQLYGNRLTGTVEWLSNLQSLISANLSDNALSGTLPDILAFPALRSLWINNNTITGAIPDFQASPVFSMLSASHNGLTGIIPVLPNVMSVLNVENNQLSGEPTLDFIFNMVSYRVAYNQLSGSAPTAPSNIRYHGSSLCPNNFDPSESARWDAATGYAPWYTSCPSSEPPPDLGPFDIAIDRSFGSHGVTRTDPGSLPSSGGIYANAIDPAGRVIALGTCFAFPPPSVPMGPDGSCLQRYLQNGQIDPSFGNAGTAGTPSGQFFRALVVDSTGRTVVAGDCQQPLSNFKTLCLARYTSAGELDTGFGGGLIVPVEGAQSATPLSYATAVKLDTQGRIVVVGTTTEAPAGFIAFRFLPDGSYDATFAAGGVYRCADASTCYAGDFAALDSEDRVVSVGGGGHVVRLDANGVVDGAVSLPADLLPPQGSVGTVMGLGIQRDGQIVFGMGVTAVFAFRLSRDLTFDTSFGEHGVASKYLVPYCVDGAGVTNTPSGLILDPFDRVLMSVDCAGSYANSTALMRFTPDGQFDASFSRDGYIVDPFNGAGGVPSGGLVFQGTKLVIGGTCVNRGDDTVLAWCSSRLQLDGVFSSGFETSSP